MDIIAHFMLGLWFWKKFANPWSLILSFIVDVDHILGYVYDRRNKKIIKFPKFLHLAFRERTWVHSLTGVFLISIPLLFFFPLEVVLVPLFSHLMLDMIDKNGIFTLPPFTSRKIQGVLPVGYLLESANHLKLYKRSHLPSLVLIILVSLLILFNI